MPSPSFNIPSSPNTVKVSIINTTARIDGISTDLLFESPIPGYDFLDCPAFSFLISHPSGAKYLFDLGVRKDWENSAPSVVKALKNRGWKVSVEKSMVEILTGGGVKAEDIGGIIWSHHHWDHTGDPSLFPLSTELIVGPMFGETYLPGYPESAESPILKSDYLGRKLREIDFDSNPLAIGNFRAYDFFNDGSFYLLDAPGHTVSHLCGLARTTSSAEPDDTFIFMGADAVHHCGEFRPSAQLPLPESITPHPFLAVQEAKKQSCPGAMFEKIHRSSTSGKSAWRKEPFFRSSKTIMQDMVAAEKTIEKLQDADAISKVLTVFAHDTSLLNVLDFFPKEANDWQEKGWRQDGMWAFLKDFQQAVEATT